LVAKADDLSLNLGASTTFDGDYGADWSRKTGGRGRMPLGRDNSTPHGDRKDIFDLRDEVIHAISPGWLALGWLALGWLALGWLALGWMALGWLGAGLDGAGLAWPGLLCGEGGGLGVCRSVE